MAKVPLLLVTAFASVALCQEFEVVSIRPSQSVDSGSDSNSDQGRFTGSNLSLKSLIITAYRMRDYQVEGPAWLASQRFDIAAKFPEALSKDREKYNAALSAMMKKMLQDRFNLTAHTDQKIFTVYALTVMKGGIKFRESPPCDSHSSSGRNTHYTGSCISMDTFAGFLVRRRADLPADLPVVDMTGLKGFYDVTLDWAPPPRPEGKDEPPATDDKGALLLDALQEQLGLKLDTRKTPIEILVVDSAEKVPTEN